MKKTIALICAGVVVILAFTVAAYVVFMRFNVDVEVRKMMIAMSNLDTFKQDSGFSWTRGVSDDRVNTTLYTAGRIDISELSQVKHETEFRVINIGAEDTYTDLSGELRCTGDTTYLTYAPPGPEVPGVSFSNEKTWVSFTEDEMLGWGAILPGLEFPIEISERKTSWTPEGIARLRYLLAAADIFVSEYNDVTEFVSGVETRVIDAQLDPDIVESFLHDIIRAKEGREPTEQERVVATRQADQLRRLAVRFWIGINDHLLYRIQAAGSFVDQDSNELIPVDIHATFKDFNEFFELTKPTNILTFDEVLQTVFASLPDAGEVDDDAMTFGNDFFVISETARLPVEEVKNTDDGDNDGLSLMLEGFYGTDSTNPDTDGDGVLDGVEVRNGHNPRGSGSLFGFGLDR